jgi:mycothiol synthase
MTGSRPYRGAGDLAAMQHLNMAAVAEAGDLGYLHPGDIAHRLYNGLRRFDLADVVRLWDDDGGLAAWATLWPHLGGFDVQARLDRADLLPALFGWAVATLPDMVVAARGRCDLLITDVFAGDGPREEALRGLGFGPTERGYCVTVRDLERPLTADLPGGFAVRSAAGPEDAAGLAAVHAAAFGSSWTAQEYADLMRSPGYDPSREFVAVAPDGRFGAFCVVWFDDVNRTGLFEPVGTAEGFRRLGLGRAVMAAGIARMRVAAMERAVVWHDRDNPGAAALYAAAGFRKRHDIVEWTRPVG